MLRISQMKMKVGHTEEELRQKVGKVLRVSDKEVKKISVRKQSLDARHKPELFYVYTVDVECGNEKQVLKAVSRKKQAEDITLCSEKKYAFPEAGKEKMVHRPVIVGCGPAGLFCAYFLAAYGYRPILLEQGAPVEERQKDVEGFWKTGVLNTASNVQFGEGGAGTFSDGKLNTLVKDPEGRIRKVLEIFTEHGAPEEILYVNKPHIGTDVLRDVIRGMREQILQMGGEIRFHTKMEEVLMEAYASAGDRSGEASLKEEGGSQRRVTGVRLADGSILETDTLILAPGHSARDTFQMLYEKQIPMEAKSFAVGVRVEHPQTLINLSQYGQANPEHLPAAAYKLTAKLPDGRGVYSFCMCPGGYVVNASSEEGHLAVNGMSYNARDGRNANSAIVVTVSPEDFGSSHPLAGIEFQRKLEKAAYEAGGGKIPVQRYGDFFREVKGEKYEVSGISEGQAALFEGHEPCVKGEYTVARLSGIFPEEINHALVDGMESFNRKIHGFSHPDTLMLAVESRTSSPVRIPRGSVLESVEIAGLYPCGEGAGYAGGITSAAVDGMKVAEAVRRRFMTGPHSHAYVKQ